MYIQRIKIDTVGRHYVSVNSPTHVTKKKLTNKQHVMYVVLFMAYWPFVRKVGRANYGHSSTHSSRYRTHGFVGRSPTQQQQKKKTVRRSALATLAWPTLGLFSTYLRGPNISVVVRRIFLRVPDESAARPEYCTVRCHCCYLYIRLLRSSSFKIRLVSSRICILSRAVL